MKLMAESMAVRTMRNASCSSSSLPRCAPPTPTSETFSPVRPSVRYGMPFAWVSCATPSRAAPATTAPATESSRNIRRLTPLRGAWPGDRRPDSRIAHLLAISRGSGREARDALPESGARDVPKDGAWPSAPTHGCGVTSPGVAGGVDRLRPCGYGATHGRERGVRHQDPGPDGSHPGLLPEVAGQGAGLVRIGA